MDVILELDGWKKEMDISLADYRRGYVYVVMYPPLNIVVHDNLPTEQLTQSVKAQFIYAGKNCNGRPLFKLN